MAQDTPTPDHEDRIRQRAYDLWQQAGSPEGGDKHFWEQAESEVAAQGSQDGGQAEQSPAPAKRKAAPRKTAAKDAATPKTASTAARKPPAKLKGETGDKPAKSPRAKAAKKDG